MPARNLYIYYGKCKDKDGDRQLAYASFDILVVESRTATHPLPGSGLFKLGFCDRIFFNRGVAAGCDHGA